MVISTFSTERGYRSLLDSEIHDRRINALEFVFETKNLISVSDDGCVKMFDTQSRRVIGQVRVTSGKLFAVAVLGAQEDVLVAVAGSDNVIHIINMTNESYVESLSGHVGSVSTLAAQYGSCSVVDTTQL